MFYFKNLNDLQLCWHFSNLQALTASANIRKSDIYNEETTVNYSTIILRFLDNLSKTNLDLFQFAKVSYTKRFNNPQ